MAILSCTAIGRVDLLNHSLMLSMNTRCKINIVVITAYQWKLVFKVVKKQFELCGHTGKEESYLKMCLGYTQQNLLWEG